MFMKYKHVNVTTNNHIHHVQRWIKSAVQLPWWCNRSLQSLRNDRTLLPPLKRLCIRPILFLSVCAKYLKTLWTDFDEILWRDEAWPREESIKILVAILRRFLDIRFFDDIFRGVWPDLRNNRFGIFFFKILYLLLLFLQTAKNKTWQSFPEVCALPTAF